MASVWQRPIKGIGLLDKRRAVLRTAPKLSLRSSFWNGSTPITFDIQSLPDYGTTMNRAQWSRKKRETERVIFVSCFFDLSQAL